MKTNHQKHLDRLAAYESASPRSNELVAAYNAYIKADAAMLKRDSTRNYDAYEAALNDLDALLPGVNHE